MQSQAQHLDAAARFNSEVRPVAGAMGAYVHGLNVTDLDAGGLAEIRSLLHTYKAVSYTHLTLPTILLV